MSAPLTACDNDMNARQRLARAAAGAPVCLLGLAAVRVWLQCVLFGAYSASDDGAFTIINNFGYGAAILLGALTALRRPPAPRTERVLGRAAFALLVAAPLVMLATGPASTGVTLMLEGMLAGVAGALGAGVWTSVYARVGTRASILYGFCSLGLGSLVCLAVSFLPRETTLVVAILAAALAQLAHRRALNLQLGDGAGADRAGETEVAGGRGAETAETVGMSGRRTRTTQVCPQTALPSAVYDREPRSTALVILGGLAVFGFALGISRGYPAGEPVPMTTGLRAVHQLGVVALSAFVVWWHVVRGRRLSFSLLWRIEIAVVAAGMFVLSVFPGHLTGLAVAMVNIADSFMLGVLWVTMQDVSRHCSLPAYSVFGLAWAVRVFSRELGRVFILAFGAQLAAGSAAGAVVGAVTAAVAASMALLLSDEIPRTRRLFAEEDEVTAATAGTPRLSGPRSETSAQVSTTPARATRAGTVGALAHTTRAGATGAPAFAIRPGRATVASTSGTSSHRATTARAGVPPTVAPVTGELFTPAEARLARRLQETWGLTEREAQVAVLLAQGRSKAAVAKRLYVTENTVRTHAKNVYAKLGVSSKQELARLLEG